MFPKKKNGLNINWYGLDNFAPLKVTFTIHEEIILELNKVEITSGVLFY